MDPNAARDLAASPRVTLTRQDDFALPQFYRVEVDGDPVGLVLRTDTGWLAARPGWVDRERPKRAAAVRRLLVSLPDATLETLLPIGGSNQGGTAAATKGGTP